LKIDEKRSLLSKSKQRTQLDGVQAALLAAGIQEGAIHGQETPRKELWPGTQEGASKYNASLDFSSTFLLVIWFVFVMMMVFCSWNGGDICSEDDLSKHCSGERQDLFCDEWIHY
jgi:hypothetical protein